MFSGNGISCSPHFARVGGKNSCWLCCAADVYLPCALSVHEESVCIQHTHHTHLYAQRPTRALSRAIPFSSVINHHDKFNYQDVAR